MRSCLVEVSHIGIEYTLELLLLKDQHMVQTLLAHTPHEPLTDRIRSGSMIERFEHLDVTCPRHTRKEGCHTESCVTMYNEKALNSVQAWLPDWTYETIADVLRL